MDVAALVAAVDIVAVAIVGVMAAGVAGVIVVAVAAAVAAWPAWAAVASWPWGVAAEDGGARPVVTGGHRFLRFRSLSPGLAIRR
ncbi:MAG TPA: hypothetical protein VGQ31_04250 [Candidatus Limnocylindrales bacterium]|nr:hypothetical protein [Candidatus Limnocylindrales bacterium]